MNAAKLKFFSNAEMNDCNVALNNAIRRIFTYNRWESVRHLRQQLRFPNLTEIFYSRSTQFLKNCLNGKTQNEVIFRLATFTKLENVED